jgi:hypothetical protein
MKEMKEYDRTYANIFNFCKKNAEKDVQRVEKFVNKYPEKFNLATS